MYKRVLEISNKSQDTEIGIIGGDYEREITWRANIHDHSFVKGYRFVILQLKVKDDQTYIILFLELYLRKTRINERIPFKYSSSEIPLGKNCLFSRSTSILEEA